MENKLSKWYSHSPFIPSYFNARLTHERTNIADQAEETALGREGATFTAGREGGREGRQREKRSEQKQTSRKQKHELSTELVKANIHEEFNALMARGQNDSKTATYFES